MAHCYKLGVCCCNNPSSISVVKENPSFKTRYTLIIDRYCVEPHNLKRKHTDIYSVKKLCADMRKEVVIICACCKNLRSVCFTNELDRPIDIPQYLGFRSKDEDRYEHFAIVNNLEVVINTYLFLDQCDCIDKEHYEDILYIEGNEDYNIFYCNNCGKFSNCYKRIT